MQQADISKITQRLRDRTRKSRKRIAAGTPAYPLRAARLSQVQGAYRMRAQRSAAALSGLLGIERKFYDTALVNSAFVTPTDASGGELDPSATSMISTPAVGDTEVNRDGKKIIIDAVYINFVVARAQTEAVVDPFPLNDYFVALVLDTQTNGAQLNSEDVFKNTAANAGVCCDVQRNLLFGKRFKVLRETIINGQFTSLTGSANAFTANGFSYHWKWYVPFPQGLEVNFNSGTTASVANVIDNSLHIIGYCNNSTAGTNPGTLSYNARIRFRG